MKAYVSGIHKELLQINKKKTDNVKTGKRHNRKEDHEKYVQMASKLITRYSAS